MAIAHPVFDFDDPLGPCLLGGRGQAEPSERSLLMDGARRQYYGKAIKLPEPEVDSGGTRRSGHTLYSAPVPIHDLHVAPSECLLYL